MAVSDSAIDAAIDLIAGVAGLRMDPDDLAEDVVLMAVSWPDEDEFMKAALATQRAMGQLIAGRVDASPLKHDLAGWFSYHYQHARAQGGRADMRIAFKPAGKGILVRAFGHRDVPTDFYARIAEQRTDAAKLRDGSDS